MMDRRTCLTRLLALGALPLAARAQQPRRPKVVGLVLPNVPVSEMIGADPISPLVRGFVHGLRDLGWAEGGNLVIVRRSADGQPSRAPSLIADLLQGGVDVLAVGGARWLHDAARQATRTVPIVAIFPDDPVAAGLIDGLARPGGNLTGVMSAVGPEFSEKQLQLLREVDPRVTRVAFIAVRAVLEQHSSVSGASGVTILPVRVDAAPQYEEAFATIQSAGVDALLVAGGPPNVVNAHRIAAFAAENRLPAMFGFREAVDAGGLISYGPSFVGVFRQTARLAAKFLDGARPGEVPTERPTTFELVLNLKSAKALGLVIPPAILLRADEVIE